MAFYRCTKYSFVCSTEKEANKHKCLPPEIRDLQPPTSIRGRGGGRSRSLLARQFGGAVELAHLRTKQGMEEKCDKLRAKNQKLRKKIKSLEAELRDLKGDE